MNIKLIIVLLLFSLLAPTTFSQENKKAFFIETQINTKIPIGNPTYNFFEYSPDVRIRVHSINKFRNPVYGLNISFNYLINNNLSAGIGSGINISKYDFHPVEVDEYIDKIMLPVYGRFNYKRKLENTWILRSNLKIGYQFADYNYGNTEDGFLFQDSGGIISGIYIGIGKNIKTYHPYLKLGYEFNQFSHKYSLKGYGLTDLSYDKQISFKTHYHLITLSLVLEI